ncbi:hypothetical protein APP_35430 [Aeribacillus pallidus]|jgi:hypothetical protein|nr:hypothetical protein APP_35430 [Aeribacillus pallidus]
MTSTILSAESATRIRRYESLLICIRWEETLSARCDEENLTIRKYFHLKELILLGTLRTGGAFYANIDTIHFGGNIFTVRVWNGG